MTYHEFCDTCPGCRPAIMLAETGKKLPPEHPTMIKINRVWNKECTYHERKAYINVTVNNSHVPAELEMTERVMKKLIAGAKLQELHEMSPGIGDV